MNILVTLALSLVLGYFTHFANGFVRKVSSSGWRSYSYYIIRSTLKMPSILMVHSSLKNDIKDTQKLTILSYIVASTAYGLGVVLGWFVDNDDR